MIVGVTLAFYRGRHSGRIGPWLLAWWQRCDWSHVAVLWQIDAERGMALVSEATLAHGVQTHWRPWAPWMWDLWELAGISDEPVRLWWRQQEGSAYDWRGLLGFIIRRIKGRSRAYWCSEAVAASIGLHDAWRYDVALMASVAKHIGKPVERRHAQHD